MKKNIEAARKYSLADSELKQVADNLLLFIERDIAEFTAWGYDAQRRADFEQRIADFIDIDGDEILEGIKMTATENKAARRDDLETRMRAIVLKAKFVFGTNSGKIKEFGDMNLTRQNDDELVRTARLTHKSATKYYADLAAEGLTMQNVQDLETAIAALDNALDEQRQAIANRDSATRERIERGNKLYELVVKYSEIGKEIFYASNEAKYNDYVIYTAPTTTSAPTEEKPEAGIDKGEAAK